MSYILEALKKSQKQRRRGTVPDVLTVQEIVVHQPSGRRVWPFIAAVILAVNAAALGWYVLGRQPVVKVPEAPAAKQTSAARADGMSGTSLLPDSGPRQTEEALAPRQAPLKAERPSGEVETVPGSSVVGTVNPRKEDTAVASGQRGDQATALKDRTAVVPQQTAEFLPPAENRLYDLTELPDAVRRSLPEISISAFMYSDQPSSRMARINGRLMREGEELQPGIRLDEISPDGVVLKYRGYRFAVALKKR